jgi:two-component system NtrC family sensor kinase
MLKLPGQAAESDASRVASERVAAAACCEPRTFEQLKSDLELRNWALNAATSHFMITDMTRRGWPIVFVNSAVANDHGYEPDELLGKSALLLLSQENDPASLAQVNEAMCAGATLRTQLRSRRKDGSTFWVGFSLAPVRNSVSSITHYVSIGADITARLEEAENRARLQRQLLDEMQERERIAIELRLSQKLESIGRLAAGIAHEINTPVQYVGDSVRFLQSAMADLESRFVV